MNSVAAWPSDIRKVARITFTASVLSLLIPIWRLTQQTPSYRLPLLESVSLILFGYLFGAIMPMFYFALYRNEGTLRFPKPLRRLSLVTAVVFASLAAWSLPDWIGFIDYFSSATVEWRSGSAAVLAFVRDPRTVNEVAKLLNGCSNVAYILLLVAFFQQSDSEPAVTTDVPPSGFLRRVTKVALVLWGIWVAFNLVRVVVTPLAIRVAAFKTGRRPPQLGHIMMEVIEMLLTQACLFIAPYVVYNSWLRRDETPDGIQPVPTAPAFPTQAETPSGGDGL